MTPIQYCYDKIAGEGSPLYFCVKKIPSEKRDGIVAIATFYQELMEVILHSTDQTVAFNQFSWWREEIVQAEPSHPVVLALRETNIPQEQLLQIMEGLLENFQLPLFDTFETTVIYLMRTAGVRELLFLEQLSLTISKEIIYQLMIVIEWVHYIQQLRHYVRKDLIYFPQDEMFKFQVAASDLHAFKTTPNIVKLLEFQVQKIERAYQNACAELTETEKKQLGYTLARCDIALATLKEIQESGFTVLENLIQLTPLRMWWISYRVK